MLCNLGIRVSITCLLVKGVFSTTPSDGPLITTTSGSFLGFTNNTSSIVSFKGVPFAKPPMGGLRFAPPQDLQHNNGSTVVNADTFGNACVQNPMMPLAGYLPGPPLNANTSEDCLSLNIWRPAKAEKNLPVLVWIHGGGYGIGAGSEWNPTGLLHTSVSSGRPIIFVSINYRLGTLGFLGSTHVPAESLSVGLQDQRAALRWVSRNAEAFGGDSSRITIFGDSAGGGSVQHHLLYPDTERTFAAAISDSGLGSTGPLPPCEFYDNPAGGAYTLLANYSGCSSAEDSFDCLRKLPFEQLWAAELQTEAAYAGTGFTPWGPCKGPAGSFIDEYPTVKMRSGDILDVPMISGTLLTEATLMLASSLYSLPQQSLENETAIFSAFIPALSNDGRAVPNDTVAHMVSIYPHREPTYSNASLFERAVDYMTDFNFLAPQRLLFDTLAEQGRENIWAFSFLERLPGAPDYLNVFHTSEVYFLDIGYEQVPSELSLTKAFQQHYIDFVNDGHPSAMWPSYTVSGKEVLQFAEGNITAIPDDLRRPQTDYINTGSVLADFGKLG